MRIATRICALLTIGICAVSTVVLGRVDATNVALVASSLGLLVFTSRKAEAP